MRVLLINNHHKMVGGAEKYYFDLAKLLKDKGHRVAFFSTLDNGNSRTAFKKYFVKKLNFKKKTIYNSLSKFPNIFYSFEAKRNVAKLLDEFRPDIVHIQNLYYYISPSIIPEITKRKIPIVQTVHDYQLISPSVIMYHDGKICEVCKKESFYKAFLHRCVKHSYMATLMAVFTLYFQNIGNFYQNSISKFISPSLFTMKKLAEYGVNKNKLVHLNNFLPQTKSHKANTGKYVLYFGRICEAKGILMLLDAAKNLPQIKFRAAGFFEDKEIKSKVKNIIKNEHIKNIKFLGFKNNQQLRKLIHGSAFIVAPSQWYENQPYSIIETLSMAKTVVASDIGGIPEIIKPEHGILFNPKNTNDFIKQIKKLWNSPNLAAKLGKSGKDFVSFNFNPELHYKMLTEVYREVINEN